MKLRKQVLKLSSENESLKTQLNSIDKNGKAVILKDGVVVRGSGAVVRSRGFSSNISTRLPPAPTQVDEEEQDLLPPPPAPAEIDEADSSIRNLTLKQLLAFVDELYASKDKYDQKCADSRLPRETMEQHMYTFLNQRYGLRSLIVENASAVIKAVNSYTHLDNAVAVFGKILRNEIDEEFRYVQKQVKDTVTNLLRVHLKAKHPRKTDDFVHSLAQNVERGVISMDEWTDIVKYMYNEEVRCSESRRTSPFTASLIPSLYSSLTCRTHQPSMRCSGTRRGSTVANA